MTLPILVIPSWRYHATQGGKIFRTEAELAEAEAQGWRDSPGAAAAVEVEPLPEIEVEAMPDDGIDKAVPKKRKS